MPTETIDANSQHSQELTAPSTVPLDSLFSPQVSNFREPVRESVTESEFNEVALDDDSAFSAVTLTSRQSQAPSLQTLVEREMNGRPKSVSSLSSMTKSRPGHKKTASTTTIRSSNNLPFLMARLDMQNADQKSPAATRGSVDGHLKLQEEFARLHKENEVEEKEEVTNGVHGAIDWGRSDFSLYLTLILSPRDFWGAVISGLSIAQSNCSPIHFPCFKTISILHLKIQKSWPRLLPRASQELSEG